MTPTTRDQGADPAASTHRSASQAECNLAAVRDSSRLTRLLSILGEPASLRVLLDRALMAISELFAADVVALLPGPGAASRAPICAVGLPEDPHHPRFGDEPCGPADEAALSGIPVVVPGPSATRLDAPLRALGVKTAAFLPALGAQAVEAVLLVARCEPLPLDRSDVDLLVAMAHRIGLVLERAHADEVRRDQDARLVEARKAESLGRMAAAIAHRFNNLLGAAAVRVEVAAAELPDGAEARADLDEALAAIREAAQVSGHMLAYLGQGGRARAPVDLAALCRSVLADLLPALPRAVHLRTALPAAPVVVLGDAGALRDLVASLVTNAWEALGTAEGEIRVELRPAAPEELQGRLLASPGWSAGEGAYACLEVADTGCGMAPETLQNAFDPFFTTKLLGRGLGLPVALGTVRAHGGAMAAGSSPGHGSRFRVFLPRGALAAAATLAPPAEALRPGRPSGLALVADDEPTILRATKRHLERMGYQVLTAVDGAEAAELFRRRGEEVGLVLLDLTMPHLDGWQALAAVRAVRPGTPVILASGYDEARAMAGAPRGRPPVFLKKPFTLEELEEAVAQAVAAAAAW